MNEDELKILKMIEAGTITADDGLKLLDAIGSSEKRKQASAKKVLKLIRLVIVDENKGNHVDIKLPLGIFKAGVKIGEKFSPELQTVMEEIDYEEILRNIDAGATGEIANINTNDGQNIKIYFE